MRARNEIDIDTMTYEEIRHAMSTLKEDLELFLSHHHSENRMSDRFIDDIECGLLSIFGDRTL